MPRLTIAEKADKVTANEARRRKEVALAEIRELERDRQFGEVLACDDVHATWFEALSRIRERVMSTPDRIAEGLVGENAQTIRIRMTEALEEALREIADAR